MMNFNMILSEGDFNLRGIRAPNTYGWNSSMSKGCPGIVLSTVNLIETRQLYGFRGWNISVDWVIPLTAEEV
jgi:hypothetical protein